MLTHTRLCDCILYSHAKSIGERCRATRVMVHAAPCALSATRHVVCSPQVRQSTSRFRAWTSASPSSATVCAKSAHNKEQPSATSESASGLVPVAFIIALLRRSTRAYQCRGPVTCGALPSPASHAHAQAQLRPNKCTCPDPYR
jgi:hypothetical protein